MQIQSESMKIVIREFWVEAMTVLIARQQGFLMGPKSSTVPLVDLRTSTLAALGDEQLMMQTIICL